MTAAAMTAVIESRDLQLRYGPVCALDGISLRIPSGRLVGLIGPDGVGKSSLLALIAGARWLQGGALRVLGADMADPHQRRRVCTRIAYLPQGLGRNLYPSLSVAETIDGFAGLFGVGGQDRRRRREALLQSVGLAPFADRLAGQLSGGMKQKLGLCCALIHEPDLLLLDEPTSGVDPISRRQFWQLIAAIRRGRPDLTVLAASADLEEAAGFEQLVALDGGRLLAAGRPAELLDSTGSTSLEQAFVALLSAGRQARHRPVAAPPPLAAAAEAVIEAQGLTRRFDGFTAVDGVDLRIQRGEIFGFLGSNGCGKTTTMKMLTGLLPPTAGQARLFGRPVDERDLTARRRVGYMAQSFSLYQELTVGQNLRLHGRLFGVPPQELSRRVAELQQRFGLEAVADRLPETLPLGLRQRLSLAVALIHRPEVLILDEPTAGVDPLARDAFWSELIRLSRQEEVTIFLSTHAIQEAARCDRVSLMHAGRVLVTAPPLDLIRRRGCRTLEEAFIAVLEEAVEPARTSAAARLALPPLASTLPAPAPFSLRRLGWTARREVLELRRDSLRAVLALLGSVLLMVVMGAGISFDVENLPFAVLDRDRTSLSRDYVAAIAGSRYFHQQPPITSPSDLDRRLTSGRLSLALEIPPHFGRSLKRGESASLGMVLDGAMPQRAETARSYMEGLHARWLAEQALQQPLPTADAEAVRVETRFLYNPELRSITAMVPAMIPLLLMLIPAMLTSLSVVREKEQGTLVNLTVTPLTRLEFLLGKQLPYLALGVANFLLLTLVATTVLAVPLRGSLLGACLGALLYVNASTAFGMLISSFMGSQLAAIFGTTLLTFLPAVSFSGLIDPVSSLTGLGAVIGRVYPTSHFLILCQGIFSKGLGLADLWPAMLPLLIAGPLLQILAVLALPQTERSA
ncbi:ribosome-associated ATPase/putative transporter RbbA [Cyanobium sp. CH-040]|uniref:ribosome-associated ATPase/putative transporter RbbA n=1 Tax=Cyanobium sp. CH-040 TaxID=2823708 RepID=UPI0020CB83E7|nr:ribosome-associated ATPase/putative transporter RbbA [Cyanobium sp. CH-040]MCP9928804.1 ribosome-associated ATPase/putative transporter RbbA [Cyanobium sp. CH-040]